MSWTRGPIDCAYIPARAGRAGHANSMAHVRVDLHPRNDPLYSSRSCEAILVHCFFPLLTLIDHRMKTQSIGSGRYSILSPDELRLVRLFCFDLPTQKTCYMPVTDLVLGMNQPRLFLNLNRIQCLDQATDAHEVGRARLRMLS